MKDSALLLLLEDAFTFRSASGKNRNFTSSISHQPFISTKTMHLTPICRISSQGEPLPTPLLPRSG